MNKIASISIANADKKGYGIDGSMSRAEWQGLCREMLYRGKDQFIAWQEDINLEYYRKNKSNNADYGILVTFRGSGKSERLNFRTNRRPQPLVLDFATAQFDERVNFNDYRFINEAQFSGAKFTSLSFISNCTFERDVWFYGAEFQKCTFYKNHFYRKAIFSYAKFNDHSVPFDLSSFKGRANFDGAEFKCDASFKYVDFSNASFIDSTFEKMALFTGRNLDEKEGSRQKFGPMNFSGSVFIGRADFSNREFTGKTSFGKANKNASYFKLAPLFHNCILHQDTDFIETKFDKPKNDPEAIRAYRTLRLHMEGLRATLEQDNFFALEQISLRNSDVMNFNEKLASELYEALSNYGRSIFIPLAWIVSMLPIFSIIYFIFLPDKLGLINRLSDSIKLSLLEYFKPFYIWSPNNHISHEWPVLIFGSIQSIAGIILLTLLILALRWKFKK